MTSTSCDAPDPARGGVVDGAGVGFDADVCDLCGSGESDVLIDLPRSRAMRSDRVVVPATLQKRACRRCGLVRSGCALPGPRVARYYAEHYALGARAEHYFYTPEGPVARSAVIATWLVSLAGQEVWQGCQRCLEVGANGGLLLRELANRFPATGFEGVEPSRDAVAIARARGLAVREGTVAEAGAADYDLVYAVAVIEHVPSPTDWLNRLRRRLRPGGWLLLVQPVQDVASYDVLFVDHLHHFGSAHLRRYAGTCRFREEAVEIGHPLMPNFSAHAWRAAEAADDAGWSGPPAAVASAAAARSVLRDLARLDERLAGLAARQRAVAVFGLGEVYWIARAYSTLGEFPVVCGLDDAPDRSEYARLGFPVVRPEQAPALGVQDVILAMNRIYYPMALERLARLGLVAHPVLT
jgi:SAM-dependent methyltransferase